MQFSPWSRRWSSLDGRRRHRKLSELFDLAEARLSAKEIETGANYKSPIKPLSRAIISRTARPKVCQVCKSPNTICYDHCHVTGQFRGWLCSGCNVAIGFVKNNPETLRKLANYLDEFSAKMKISI